MRSENSLKKKVPYLKDILGRLIDSEEEKLNRWEEQEECSLKNNKTIGQNRIPEEIFKYVGARLQERMSQLIKRVWRKKNATKVEQCHKLTHL